MSLADRLPSLLSLTPNDSDIGTWLEEHQAELNRFGDATAGVQDSLQVAHATGDELDRIGADFGVLGRRRGRDDDAYRAYLMSLAAAFDGRGTPPGLRTAVAAGILATSEDVSLIEDFDAQRYEVVLENEAWSAHKSGTVRELAELADPSVVTLREPVHNRLSTATIDLTPGPTAIASGTELSTATVVLAPGPATKESATVGLSAEELGPLSTDSWVLSTIKRPAATIVFVPGETTIRSMHTSETARVSVAPGETTTRQMTRASPASITAQPAESSAATLSERGLSSAQLGPLSSTEISELSAV